ncbi:MAG TPA: hypothetical protein VNO22_06695 [Planctomycetota bacterium]|nr:hypothetical protein [Planctomycetota bacterium]
MKRERFGKEPIVRILKETETGRRLRELEKESLRLQRLGVPRDLEIDALQEVPGSNV